MCVCVCVCACVVKLVWVGEFKKWYLPVQLFTTLKHACTHAHLTTLASSKYHLPKVTAAKSLHFSWLRNRNLTQLEIATPHDATWYRICVTDKHYGKLDTPKTTVESQVISAKRTVPAAKRLCGFLRNFAVFVCLDRAAVWCWHSSSLEQL